MRSPVNVRKDDRWLPHSSGGGPSLSAVLGAAALVAGLASAQAAQAAPAAAAQPKATYLVQLADAPAAGYTGGVAGYAGTKPAAGTKIDASAAAVSRYRGYLGPAPGRRAADRGQRHRRSTATRSPSTASRPA